MYREMTVILLSLLMYHTTILSCLILLSHPDDIYSRELEPKNSWTWTAIIINGAQTEKHRQLMAMISSFTTLHSHSHYTMLCKKRERIKWNDDDHHHSLFIFFFQFCPYSQYDIYIFQLEVVVVVVFLFINNPREIGKRRNVSAHLHLVLPETETIFNYLVTYKSVERKINGQIFFFLSPINYTLSSPFIQSKL